MKILIAEDDADSLHLLERTLTKWGYDVIAVSDGAKAASILTSKDIPLAGHP